MKEWHSTSCKPKAEQTVKVLLNHTELLTFLQLGPLIFLVVVSLSCAGEETKGNFSPSNNCGDVDCFPDECILEDNHAICISTETPNNENISETEDLDLCDQESDFPIEQEPVEEGIPQECEPQDDPLLLPGEIRLTTDGDFIDMPFINYDIHENTVVFCDDDWKMHICKLPCGTCEIKEFPDSEYDCVYPTVYKDTVACNTRLIHRDPENREDLLLYNISSGEIRYPTDVGDYLDMHGNWIVWIEFAPDLYYYNIADGTLKSIETSSSSTSDCLARTSDEKIVWIRNYSNEYTDVMLIDLHDSSSLKKINETKGYTGDPAISGNWIVWISDLFLGTLNPNGESILRAYNLFSNERITIDPQPHQKTYPDIDGSRVVWTDFRNGGRDSFGYYFNSDIWLYDLERREARPIAETNLLQLKPRISGRWVLYLDTRWRSPQDDLVVFDLCTLDWYESDPMCVGSSKKRQNH